MFSYTVAMKDLISPILYNLWRGAMQQKQEYAPNSHDFALCLLPVGKCCFAGTLTNDEKKTGSIEPNRTEPWHRTHCHVHHMEQTRIDKKRSNRS